MGRIEDLERDKKKAGSDVAESTQNTSKQAGAEWIPNTTGRQPGGESQVPGRRSTDQFVSAKRKGGALAPTPTANSPNTGSASATVDSNPTADPYSHLRPNAWRDVRHHAHTSDPQDIPPQEAEVAYEVVAVAVNPDDDEKGGKKNRNPLRDWRVWLLIVAVAVIVGVSAGVAVGSGSRGSNSSTNSLGQQQNENSPQDVGIEIDGIDGNNGIDIDEIPKVEETGKDDQDVEKNDAPTQPLSTLPPTQGPTESPPSHVEDLPPSPSISQTDRDASLPLSQCSKSGRPAVDLQPFSIYLTTTYADAPNQVPAQVFVNTVFQYLWPYIQKISGVYGYSFKYDLVFRRRLLEGMTNRHMLRQKYRDSDEIITGAHLISNRRHLQMGGSEFKAVLYGCVELADGYSAAPSYNDLQTAIETAFSVDNLRTWLTEAQNGGIDVTGVTTLDEEGNVIGVMS